MFGLASDREHHVGDVLRLVHADDREHFRRFLDDPQPAQAHGPIDHRVAGPKGETRWHSSHGSTQVDRTQALPALMGATIDIADRKRAEDEDITAAGRARTPV